MAAHTLREGNFHFSFLVTKAAAISGTMLTGDQHVLYLIRHQDSGNLIHDKCNEK
jgi:hypothetical protein